MGWDEEAEVHAKKLVEREVKRLHLVSGDYLRWVPLRVID